MFFVPTFFWCAFSDNSALSRVLGLVFVCCKQESVSGGVYLPRCPHRVSTALFSFSSLCCLFPYRFPRADAFRCEQVTCPMLPPVKDDQVLAPFVYCVEVSNTTFFFAVFSTSLSHWSPFSSRVLCDAPPWICFGYIMHFLRRVLYICFFAMHYQDSFSLHCSHPRSVDMISVDFNTQKISSGPHRLEFGVVFKNAAVRNNTDATLAITLPSTHTANTCPCPRMPTYPPVWVPIACRFGKGSPQGVGGRQLSSRFAGRPPCGCCCGSYGAGRDGRTEQPDEQWAWDVQVRKSSTIRNTRAGDFI